MGAYGSVPKADFRWIAGEEHISVYQQTEHTKRLFCSTCGSFLASTHELAPSQIYISLGCLAASEHLEVEYQQFVGSKANWVHLNQDITQYATWPDWIHKRLEK